MAKYKLEFQLDGLPKTRNRIGARWYQRKAEADKWKTAVAQELARHTLPSKPIQLSKLTLTRHSSIMPDYDGLVSSFKHIIDALIRCGVIEDDKMTNFVGNHPVYRHEMAPPKCGHIAVIVLEA